MQSPDTEALVDRMRKAVSQLDADRERLTTAISILEAEESPRKRRGRPPRAERLAEPAVA